MDFPQLIGQFYTSLSLKAECQSAKNLYLERIESGAGRNVFAMYRSPGLGIVYPQNLTPTKFTTRGLFVDPTDAHLFVIEDDTFLDLLADWTLNSSLAPIANDGKLVSLDASINSLFIVSAGIFYRIFGGALTTPVTPFVPAAVVTLGGYVICLEDGTNKFFFSVDDGATWNALDFQTAEAAPNTLINMVVDHQELWLYGNRKTQVFVLGTDPDAPFVPVSSGVIEMGLEAKFAFCQLDNSLFWLGKNENGDRSVFRANGYTPTQISTHAINNEFRKYPRSDDATMGAFDINGHACFRLTFPSANDGRGATWEYDISSSAWTERSWRNIQLGLDYRHRGNCYASAFGKIIVGDHSNGFLYSMSPDEFTDFGYPIRWERRTTHVTKDGHQIQYKRFDVFAQVGVGLTSPLWLNAWTMTYAEFVAALATAVGVGSVTAAQAITLQRIFDLQPYIPLAAYPTPDVMNALGFYPWGAVSMLSNNTVIGDPPQMAARWSDDGGDTFNAFRNRSMGAAGSKRQRIYWGGIGTLGMARDRVWELSGDSPNMLAIVQGTFEADVCPY